VNGFREGIQREFFDNADVKEEWVAEKGAAVGEVKKWHENGKVKSVGNYEFCAELSYYEWDATGKLVESRRIDKHSGLMKYMETMHERASK
jgi:antitoxin component YwqK of YwqJK toxin-antitoxin module